MRAPYAPPSPLHGTPRVGADYFERVGAARHDLPWPRGLIDRMDAYGHAAVDLTTVPAEIQRFFLDPAGLTLRVRSEWRGVAAWLWPLARRVLAAIGQFALPVREAVVRVRVVALDPSRDGRAGARAVVRCFNDGSVMQAVAYATHTRAGCGYMSASFPLPWCALLGVLRLDDNGTDVRGVRSVVLSSTPSPDGPDTGVWLTGAFGRLPLPLGERLALYTPDMTHCPAALRDSARAGETMVALHEQRFFGWVMVRHRYYFTPTSGS